MNAQEYLKRGIEYYEKQDDNRAYADFTEAYRLDPNLAGVKKYLACFYYNFGAESYQKGEIDTAIEHFEKAAEFDNTDAQYFETLAKILIQQKKDNELIDAWKKLKPIEPTPFVLSALAYAYHYRAKECRFAGDEDGFFVNQKASIKALEDCQDIVKKQGMDSNYERIEERLAAAKRELELRKEVYEAIG